jgi:RNase P/RNase MRP subunit p29
VHTDIPELNVLMKKSAEAFGVKGHIVGFTQKVLCYGPADIEAHLGNDGRYYVLDTARWVFV